MLPRCDKSRTCGIGIEYILFPCHFHIVTVFPFANRMHPLETASPLIYNRNLIPATTSNQKLFTSILLPERKRGILQFDCLYSTGNQLERRTYKSLWFKNRFIFIPFPS